MIKINAQSLRDYQVCERYYDYKYNEQVGVKSPQLTREKVGERYSETIRTIANFFFYKKQAFSEPSYDALLNRWQKLWFKPDTAMTDFATTSTTINYNSETSYTSLAAHLLLLFHEEFSNRPELEVVLIDEPFTVPINDKVALEGTFDLVLRQKLDDGSYEYLIYKWITDDLNRPLNYWVFDFTMMDYAFKYRDASKNIKKVRFFTWYFGGNTSKASKEILVESEDFATLNFWCKDLADKKLFVPRRGLTAYCKGCVYDRICESWSFKNNV